jgi:glycosyltransferase involved in cell wall biosynthesis
MQPHISIIVPVFKAENCLIELYSRLAHSLSQIVDSFEIIFIEDCGEDKSWPLIIDLAKRDHRVKGYKFSRNFGQHYGITAGLDICEGDWVVVMDCDLQDRPEDIHLLYSKAQEGFDVVLARRGVRKDKWINLVTSWLFYKTFNYLADLNYDGNVGNFRIISKKVAKNYVCMREQMRFFGGLISWMGFNTADIVIQQDERYAGGSSYTFKKRMKLAIEIIIAYSDKPLRMAVKFGFLISFFSFLYGGYIIYKGLTNDLPIMGWSSIMASIYFIGGIIIMNIGVLGIYLGKAYDEVKRRPLYIISESTQSGHIK